MQSLQQLRDAGIEPARASRYNRDGSILERFAWHVGIVCVCTRATAFRGPQVAAFHLESDEY